MKSSHPDKVSFARAMGVIVGCSVLVLGTGCVSVPPASGVAVPPAWVGRAPAVPLDVAALPQWWKRFRDPALDALVAEAIRSSPDLRTAASRIAESRARFGTARAALFPTASGGLSGQGARRDSHAEGRSTSENYEASLDASWQVDLFGRERQNVKGAAANLAQAEEDFHGAQVALTAEVATAYIALRQAEAQLLVAEESVAIRGDTTQITEWKEKAGTGNALDTLQARSTLEQARAAIPRLKQTISQTKHRLALLCGRVPGAIDPLVEPAKPLPRVPARLALGIPAETLRQRPDVRSAERGIDAAVAFRKAAERERLPSLSLSGVLSAEAIQAGKLFSPDLTVASMLGSLSAPIFNAGRIGQNIKLQGELERQAVIAYEKTILTALSEVEDALVAIRRTAEQLAVLERAAVDAREAAKLAQQQHEAGQVNVLSVLEAQRTLLSIEDQRVSTQADELSAHIQLYKALGGGWSPR